MRACIFSWGSPTGSRDVIFGQNAPPGRISRKFRLHMRAPFQWNPYGVTSHPVAMSIVRNGACCTHTIVRKKRGNRLPMRMRSLPIRTASGKGLFRGRQSHSGRFQSRDFRWRHSRYIHLSIHLKCNLNRADILLTTAAIYPCNKILPKNCVWFCHIKFWSNHTRSNTVVLFCECSK
jgi:hypothetical protein